MSFSGAVKLADINDYLAPSQACIKPQLDAKRAQQAREKEAAGASSGVVAPRRRRGTGKKRSRGTGVKISIESDPSDDILGSASGSALGSGGHFDQIRTGRGDTAKITLNDCLACSGCVTSAETVLITSQSLDEFISQVKCRKNVVLSISPQALAALAVRHGVTPLQAARRLRTVLRSAGIAYLADTGTAQCVSLVEAREEFVRRYRAKQTPVLCSECPGWVCYAEKTQGGAMLGLLSQTRSPQQIIGVYVKRILGPRIGAAPGDMYHAAVMPCYDKKLEAARGDFASANGVRDVDIVLTTAELQDLIDRETDGNGLSGVAESDLDPLIFGVSEDQKRLFRPPDVGASGGYLENIFRYAAEELFDAKLPSSELKLVQGRNPDIREVVYEESGSVRLRFALAYGFRNIQNTVRKIKRGKCTYDYVEIMACPSGCTNGGGQIRPDKASGEKPRALAARVAAAYRALPVRRPEDSPLLARIRAWAAETKVDKASWLQVKFKDVSEEKKPTHGLAVKW